MDAGLSDQDMHNAQDDLVVPHDNGEVVRRDWFVGHGVQQDNANNGHQGFP